MEKIIDAVLELIEVVTISEIIGFGRAKGIQVLHDEVRRETVKALNRPSPSLSHFSNRKNFGISARRFRKKPTDSLAF